MKNVLIFLSGVAVGIAGTAIWTMKKLIPELREEAARKAQEELHAMPDYSEYLTDEEEEESSESNDISSEQPAEMPSDQVKKVVQNNREAPMVDYSKYMPEPEKSVRKNQEAKTSEKKPEPEADPEENPVVVDI